MAAWAFRERDWKRRTEEFSGGWQMRIALAKLLLEKPNLLLLDEPTNHLDLEARNWLEAVSGQLSERLRAGLARPLFSGRHRAPNRGALEQGRCTSTPAATRATKSRRPSGGRSSQAAYDNQQDRIRQLEAFINRFRYQATKAKQVQSRIKELEQIERIEIPPEEKTIHFRFPQPKPSGRIVAEFQKVAKSYGDQQVFADVDFYIERGDRVALVGVNGAGKSTLIKMLAGAEPVTAGEYTLGHNAAAGLLRAGPIQGARPRRAPDRRSWPRWRRAPPTPSCAAFWAASCSPKTTCSRRIGVLSGGERNRYALARMLMMPSNFLLLDEPTNHLDMRAKDVLLTALQEFTGTVVFVSHDRYFIDKLATRIFEVEDGRVHVFPGNYEDYLWRKSGGAAANGAADSQPVAGTPGAPALPAKPAQRLNPIKLQQMKDRRSEIEADVVRLEAEIADAEAALGNFVSVEETTRLTELVAARQTGLAALLEEWERVAQAIEVNS